MNDPVEKTAAEQDGQKLAAWRAAHVVPGYDPDSLRRDDFGYFIALEQYGNFNSEYGWEIQYRNSAVPGSSEDRETLRAMHWFHNARRGRRREKLDHLCNQPSVVGSLATDR